jgi:hypothetical protein
MSLFPLIARESIPLREEKVVILCEGIHSLAIDMKPFWLFQASTLETIR